MNIGRRIYYDIPTGNVIVDTGERSGDVVETTINQDIAAYVLLAERQPNTFGCLELEYGQFAEDFATCTGYIVNPVAGEILFSYDPVSPPAYRPPLSEQIAEQEARLADIEMALIELFGGGI